MSNKTMKYIVVSLAVVLLTFTGLRLYSYVNVIGSVDTYTDIGLSDTSKEIIKVTYKKMGHKFLGDKTVADIKADLQERLDSLTLGEKIALYRSFNERVDLRELQKTVNKFNEKTRFMSDDDKAYFTSKYAKAFDATITKMQLNKAIEMNQAQV